jgi:uncharacterized protein involved in outer membrane biogenesis
VSRRLRILLVVLGVAVATVTAAGAVAVWLLPDIIRREAMTRIPALTGRAVRIEDVDLNPFTGRFAVKGIWLAERDGRTAFVELPLVEGRLWLPALLAMDIRLLELRLVGLSARVARTGAQEFNFSDLMELLLKVDPAAKPTRWTFTLDQVALEQGKIHAEDRVVSPAANWSIDRLEAHATGITKRSGAPPGHLTVKLKIGDLVVDVAADDVRLAPVVLAAKVTVKGLDLARLIPYVPPGAPVVAESGALAVSLSLGWKREPGRVDVAVVHGDVNLSSVALSQPGRTAPFATIPRMSVRIKEADAIGRRVVIERVLLEGLEVHAVRDDAGQIDLLGPFAVKRETPGPPDPAAVPVPPARPPPERPWQVRVEQVAVTSATAVFTDGMASPAVDWRVEGVSFEAAGLDTDVKGSPGTMRLDAELTASSAPSMRATVSVTGTSLRVEPMGASFKATIKGFDEASTVPYVPPGTPVTVVAGILEAEADVDLHRYVASAPPAPDAPPAPALVVDVPRFTLRSDSLTLADHSLSPAHEWELSGVQITGGGLSTSPDDPPANVTVRARIGPPRAPDPAPLRVQADALRVFRRASRVRVSISAFKLVWLEAYVPPVVRALPQKGLLAAEIDARLGRSRTGVTRARAGGTATLTDVAVVRRGESVPFLTTPKVALELKRADVIAHTIDLTSAAVEGFRVRVVRGPDGRIDVMDLQPTAEPLSAGVSPGPPAAPGVPPVPWSINVDRLSLTRGRAQFVDQAMSPPVTLTVPDIEITGQQVTWPSTKPTTINAAFGMPGGGRTEVRLTGTVDPLDVQLRTSTRDAEIASYAAYFPFPASFRGRFNGDSLSEVKKEGDEYRAASRGTGWATDLEVVDPESPTPPARVQRMEIRGIDFSWPNYALVDKIVFSRPEARIERAADGTINLRRLFTPRKREDAGDSPAPTAPPPEKESAPASTEAPPKPPLIQTIVLDFSEIAIEDGYIRFFDRSTTPNFSEEISKLALTVKGLSNVLGRQQTTLVATAAVGGDAALDLRGELSGIGETLRADIVGEIRDFDLTSANPYTDGLTSWVVERGTLAAKVHYRIEGDRITAEHDVNFGKLQVTKAKTPGEDEAKKRLGLPLGLIVGLLKDTQGNIDFNLPITGSLADRNFDWNSAIWTGAKQVIMKALAAPFRAIGRLFTGGGADEAKVESIHINPVTFAAGSAVISPSSEQHIAQVAEFLRKSPAVALSATAVATGPDLESLRTQELTARIVKLQEERKLADFPAAVQAYYRALRIPGKRPPTTEEQLAVLRERAPAPDPSVIRDLLDRRAAAATGALTKLEGIAPERIRPAEPRSVLTETAEGRVEFALVGQ